jgi:hypothetical protein
MTEHSEVEEGETLLAAIQRASEPSEETKAVEKLIARGKAMADGREYVDPDEQRQKQEQEAAEIAAAEHATAEAELELAYLRGRADQLNRRQ